MSAYVCSSVTTPRSKEAKADRNAHIHQLLLLHSYGVVARKAEQRRGDCCRVPDRDHWPALFGRHETTRDGERDTGTRAFFSSLGSRSHRCRPPRRGALLGGPRPSLSSVRPSPFSPPALAVCLVSALCRMIGWVGLVGQVRCSRWTPTPTPPRRTVRAAKPSHGSLWRGCWYRLGAADRSPF